MAGELERKPPVVVTISSDVDLSALELGYALKRIGITRPITPDVAARASSTLADELLTFKVSEPGDDVVLSFRAVAASFAAGVALLAEAAQAMQPTTFADRRGLAADLGRDLAGDDIPIPKIERAGAAPASTLRRRSQRRYRQRRRPEWGARA